MLTSDYPGLGPNSKGPVHGPDGYRTVTAPFLAAFPDAHFTIEQLIGEGEMVAARLSLRTTQTGPFAGVAPAGRHIALDGIMIYLCVGGKIGESRGLWKIGGHDAG